MKKKFIFTAILGATILSGQTGRVGINTAAPTATLHVKGSLRLENPSAGSGKILRVYGDGSMKWDQAVPLPALGTFDSANGFSGAISAADTYYNASITLPQGKWLVKLSLLITPGDTSNKDESVLVSTYLSDSKTTYTPTPDIIPGSSTRMSGVLYTPSLYGIVYGSMMINNTGITPKSYYLIGTSTRTTVGTTIVTWQNFTANTWGENRLYAITIQ